MNIGRFLGMTFMLFTGTQPDWADIAQKLTPASKAEILVEVKKGDELCMKGDSVRVIPGMDPKEYSYTNYYELRKVLDKYRGGDHRTLNESMVEAVLPMISIDVRFDYNVEVDSVSFKLDNFFSTYLWHPEGFAVPWLSGRDYKVGVGQTSTSSGAIEFVNKFLDEPYVFNIKYCSDFWDFKYIGVLRDGKMIVYDRDGGRYDGIEDMVLKNYGPVEEYIEIINAPPDSVWIDDTILHGGGIGKER